MNPTEYWEERLQQMQADHEAEVRRLQERIVELEDRLEQMQQMLADFTQLVRIETHLNHVQEIQFSCYGEQWKATLRSPQPHMVLLAQTPAPPH